MLLTLPDDLAFPASLCRGGQICRQGQVGSRTGEFARMCRPAGLRVPSGIASVTDRFFYVLKENEGMSEHDSPHLSDRPENVCEEWLVLQHEGEALHQRT